MKPVLECLFGAVLCIPMICVVLYWLAEDWIKGRRIGTMDI